MIDGLWEKANKISELGCRLDGIAGILELVGEHLTDNAESGACWSCAEWLRKYGEELEELSTDIMEINRLNSEPLEPVKGKKK